MTPPLNVPFDTVGRIFDPANAVTASPKKDYASEPPQAFNGFLGKALASQTAPEKAVRAKNQNDKNQRVEKPSNPNASKTAGNKAVKGADPNDKNQKIAADTSVEKPSESDNASSDAAQPENISAEATLLSQVLQPEALVVAGSLAILPPAPLDGVLEPLAEVTAISGLNASDIDSSQAVSGLNIPAEGLPAELALSSPTALEKGFVQVLSDVKDSPEVGSPNQSLEALSEGENASVLIADSSVLSTETPQFLDTAVTEVLSGKVEIPEALTSITPDSLKAVDSLSEKTSSENLAKLPTLQTLAANTEPQSTGNQATSSDADSQKSGFSANLSGASSAELQKVSITSGTEKHTLVDALLKKAKGESEDSEIPQTDAVFASTDLASDPALVPQSIDPLNLQIKGIETPVSGIRESGNALPRFEGNVVDQVVQGASLSVQNGRKELTLQLNPENMGQLRIHLSTLGDNQISARLIADNLETHKELQAQMDSLKTALESQGLQVQRITVVHAGSNMNAGTQDQHFSDAQQNNFQQLAQQNASQHYHPESKGQQQGLGHTQAGGESINASSEEIEAGVSNVHRSSDPLNPSGRVSLLI